MRLDLNVLRHLGLRLYSNIAAVLSEAVANAWDADASTVKIFIDPSGEFIDIQDDGRGMTVAEANARFLNVGYDKRGSEGSKSRKGRLLMGRKGIGKLALFSIADTVRVISHRSHEVHGFAMSASDIEASIKAREEYRPLAVRDAKFQARRQKLKRGTWIRLEDLKKRAKAQTVTALRKRIARRFSVFGRGFKVLVNSDRIELADRDDLSRCQFLWEFEGGEETPENVIPHVERRAELASVLRIEGVPQQVRGWIGSARQPKDLETDEAGNLNSIIVLARGRLIQENILDRVNASGLFTKYLTGQIEADFLDLDEADDIATSDRQRVIEDDPRYRALLEFLRTSLNAIDQQWTRWRADMGTREAINAYPGIEKWLDALPQKTQLSAKRVIGSIQGLALSDEQDRESLLRYGLVAFERLRLTESTKQLEEALETRAEELLPLIGENDQLEAALYLDIIRARLQVIKSFEGLVDGNEKEKVLQQFLFDHLWLLDPSWERAAGSERMEKRVQAEFSGIDAKLTRAERAGRVDIKYRTMAGKHVIIELKRYTVGFSPFDLLKQGAKYRTATRKILRESARAQEPVEIVFVVGQAASDDDPEEAAKAVAAINGRIVTYEQLIQGAIGAYTEYLQQRKKIDTIEALLKTKRA
jgi:hypothetical protein